MKAIQSFLIVTLASGALMAQTPAKTPAPVTPKAPPSQTVTPAAKPAMTPAKPAPAAAKPSVPAAKPATMTTKPAAAEKIASPMATKKHTSSKPAKVATPASAKEVQSASRVTASRPAGKRDPFVSPIVRATGGGPVCETGKRCLMVDQISLKGIVKSPSGYIAVVENAAKRAYFLRENDPVFNGNVVKITGDTVVFRTAVTDKLGKQEMKEVVKKVNAPVV